MNLDRLSPGGGRALWITATLLVLFTVTGFFILPPIVKVQLVKRLSTELGRPVTVGKVRVNPYALSLTIENLEVGERTGPETFFGWRRFYARFGALASLGGDWILPEFALDGFHARVVVNPDGTINLLNLLPSGGATTGAPPVPAASMPPVDLTVGEVALKDFKVDVTDLAAPRPVQLGLSNLQGSLKNVTLAEGAVMPLQFSLAWAPQGTVQIEGSLSVKHAVKLVLKTEVAGLAILPLSPYLEQFANARITQGAVSTSNRVQFALGGPQPVAMFEGDGRVDKFGLVDGAHLEDLASFSALALAATFVYSDTVQFESRQPKEGAMPSCVRCDRRIGAHLACARNDRRAQSS